MRPGDVEAVARLWASPRVTRHLGGPRDKAGLRQALRKVHDAPTYDLWAVVDVELGKVVGHCGLLPRRLGTRDVIELVYVFGSRHWGRGLATEAARAVVDHGWSLGLERVVAVVAPENLGSIRVARKLGMTIAEDLVRADGSRAFVFAVERPG